MANFCSECGEKFSVSNPKFCPNCGQDLGSSETTPNRETSIWGSAPAQVMFDALEWKFTPVTPDGFSPGVFEFGHSNKALVVMQAATWFGDDGLTESQLLETTKSSDSDEETIHRSFTHLNHPLEGFAPIRWEESNLGKRFISALEELEVSFAPMAFGATAEVVNDDGTKTREYIGEVIDLIGGPWGMSDGQRFLQAGRIYRSESTGEEKIYWHIEALVRTRYIGETSESNISRKVRIPALLQSILYVSETKFPSSFVSMPRSLSFEIEFEESHKIPMPYIQVEENVRASYVDSNNSREVLTFFAPEVTRLGYIVESSLSDEDLRKFIPTLLDSLMQVPNILVDGFANWNDGTEVPFQNVTGSDLSRAETSKSGEVGAIVPGAIYGALCARSNREYERIYTNLTQVEGSKDLELLDSVITDFIILASFGIGEIFSHSVNSLANTVIEYRETSGNGFIELLRHAARYPVDFQHVNALSNLARMYLKMGDEESAEAVIDSAIPLVNTRLDGIINQTNSMNWNSSYELVIIEEVYETFISLKKRFGKEDEIARLAPEIIEFCTKNSIEGGLKQAISMYE